MNQTESPASAETPANNNNPRAKRRFQIASKSSLRRLGALAVLIAIVLVWAFRTMIWMPGDSFRGPSPELTNAEKECAARMREDVYKLAGELGGRSLFFPRRLADSALYLDSALSTMGYRTQSYTYAARGTTCPNIEVELRGTSRPTEIVVVGAHYDAFQGSAGADDNASGVAGVLELARQFHNRPQARTIRFVLFVNEEPPCFMTDDMGSLVYARACRARGDDIVAMLSLESIGYYSDAEGSQKYPPPLSALYPSRGDFIAFVGSSSQRDLVRKAISTFRESAEFPSEGAALFEGVPGVGWSDHWAFWKCGYRALMVTDTAPFRNPNYHTAGDRPETLNYEHMSRVVHGLNAVIVDLATK